MVKKHDHQKQGLKMADVVSACFLGDVFFWEKHAYHLEKNKNKNKNIGYLDLLFAMVTHHPNPPFGRRFLVHFFHPHRRVARLQGYEEILMVQKSSEKTTWDGAKTL